MVAGTVVYPSLAVLASVLLDDLSLTPGSFGILVFSFSAVSALASPFAGGVADRLGGRTAVLITFGLAGLGFLAMSASPSLAVLIASTMLLAGGQAIMNPATNRLIRDHSTEGRRGVITGVKQSGVYVGYVVVGVSAPAVASAWGWRSFLVVLGVFLLGAGVFAARVLPAGPGARPDPRAHVPSVPRWVWVLSGYGFLMGTASSSGTFLPLFAEAELGFSNAMAGLLTAFLGVAAIVTRIVGARLAERGRRYRSALSIAAATGVVCGGLVLASQGVPALIWVAAVMFALGLSAWNAIGMLAVIDLGGPRLAGAATGRVLLGFLLGLAIGPLGFGWLIDGAGFEMVWSAVAVLTTGAVVVARLWKPAPVGDVRAD